MDTIQTDKWVRISGSGECPDCGRSFTVSIAANEIELHGPGYLDDSYPGSDLMGEQVLPARD